MGGSMTVIESVVTRLQVIMNEKSISQYDIHKNGGIAKSTISQILNLKHNKITLDILYQILSTIGVSLKEFFDDPIFNEITD